MPGPPVQIPPNTPLPFWGTCSALGDMNTFPVLTSVDTWHSHQGWRPRLFHCHDPQHPAPQLTCSPTAHLQPHSSPAAPQLTCSPLENKWVSMAVVQVSSGHRERLGGLNNAYGSFLEPASPRSGGQQGWLLLSPLFPAFTASPHCLSSAHAWKQRSLGISSSSSKIRP